MFPVVATVTTKLCHFKIYRLICLCDFLGYSRNPNPVYISNVVNAIYCHWIIMDIFDWNYWLQRSERHSEGVNWWHNNFESTPKKFLVKNLFLYYFFSKFLLQHFYLTERKCMIRSTSIYLQWHLTMFLYYSNKNRKTLIITSDFVWNMNTKISK